MEDPYASLLILDQRSELDSLATDPTHHSFGSFIRLGQHTNNCRTERHTTNTIEPSWTCAEATQLIYTPMPISTDSDTSLACDTITLDKVATMSDIADITTKPPAERGLQGFTTSVSHSTHVIARFQQRLIRQSSRTGPTCTRSHWTAHQKLPHG